MKQAAAHGGKAHRVTRSSELWCAGLLVVSALAYSLWVAGPLLNPGLDQLHGYVSELAARDQPAATLFRGADVIAGLTAASAAAIRVLSADRLARPAAWLGWLGVLVFGLATFLDSWLVPLDCAPSVDSGCAAREAAGTLSTGHQLHPVTSSVAAIGALTGIAGLGVAGPGPRRWWAVAFFVVAGGAVLATLVAIKFGGLLGLFQQLQLATVGVWLLALAGGVRRRGF